MAELSNFEKFSRGIPLTPELASLRGTGDFNEEPEVDFAQAVASANDPDHSPDELTRAELLDLKELRMSRGWAVIQKLQQISLRAHEQSAISLSKTRPLENKENIAIAWTMVTMLARAKLELSVVVDEELKKLIAETKRNEILLDPNAAER